MLGPLFGLVFLIYPVRAVLTSDPTPARVSLALVGAALFAGVFLWLMWMQEPLWSASAESSEVRKRRATIAFLAVLALALNLALGSEWRVLFFHVNVAAGIMLLTRDAYVAIAGLAVITFGLGAAMAISAVIGAVCSVGGFSLAYRVEDFFVDGDRTDPDEVREKMLELIQQKVEGKEITEAELGKAIRSGTLSLKIVPILCGSAFRNKGVQLRQAAPSPAPS